MANNLPIFPAVLVSYGVINVAITTATNVVVGGLSGTKVESMVASSNDTIDHLITLSSNVNGTLFEIGSVLVAANTGNLVTSQNGINFMTSNAFSFLPKDSNGNPYIYLANGACGVVAKSNTLNSATGGVVSVSGQASNY
jgi:hypothetical protein